MVEDSHREVATVEFARTSAARPPGRPPGSDSTRAAILAAARAAFASTGFEGTSVRAVASRAGVDPSTVLHFFATKDGLFRAVISEVAPATAPLVEALQRRAGGTELATLYLGIWAGEDSGPAIQALIRAAFGSERATELLREVLLHEVFDAVDADDPLGAELALTHLLGIALGRHLGHLPALSRAAIDAIAARVGPTLDTYLSPAARTAEGGVSSVAD